MTYSAPVPSITGGPRQAWSPAAFCMVDSPMWDVSDGLFLEGEVHIHSCASMLAEDCSALQVPAMPISFLTIRLQICLYFICGNMWLTRTRWLLWALIWKCRSGRLTADWTLSTGVVNKSRNHI